MKHARKDYDRIQDPAGLIPIDEPVFLLRGQDRFAAEAVTYWADLVAGHGGDQEIIGKARMQAERMGTWAIKKMPDLPADENGVSDSFGVKIRSMYRDLARIVNAMNLDRSNKAATIAQEALGAVAELETEIYTLGIDEWPWSREDVEAER